MRFSSRERHLLSIRVPNHTHHFPTSIHQYPHNTHPTPTKTHPGQKIANHNAYGLSNHTSKCQKHALRNSYVLFQLALRALIPILMTGLKKNSAMTWRTWASKERRLVNIILSRRMEVVRKLEQFPRRWMTELERWEWKNA